MKKLVYQQGDVLLYETKDVPAGAVRVEPKNGRYVLAEGEATGHAHAIEATPEVELYEQNGTLYLRVAPEAPPLTHEEHGPHTLGPGIFQVGRVMEVDPFTEEIRQVSD